MKQIKKYGSELNAVKFAFMAREKQNAICYAPKRGWIGAERKPKHPFLAGFGECHQIGKNVNGLK